MQKEAAPAAVNPAAMTPPAVTPAVVNLAAVTPAAVTPDAVAPAAIPPLPFPRLPCPPHASLLHQSRFRGSNRPFSRLKWSRSPTPCNDFVLANKIKRQFPCAQKENIISRAD